MACGSLDYIILYTQCFQNLVKKKQNKAMTGALGWELNPGLSAFYCRYLNQLNHRDCSWRAADSNVARQHSWFFVHLFSKGNCLASCAVLNLGQCSWKLTSWQIALMSAPEILSGLATSASKHWLKKQLCVPWTVVISGPLKISGSEGPL